MKVCGKCQNRKRHNTPYVAEYDGADAGKMAHYMLRWRMRDGSTTAWAETVSATITGLSVHSYGFSCDVFHTLTRKSARRASPHIGGIVWKTLCFRCIINNLRVY